MTKRALFVCDWCKLSNNQLMLLTDLSEHYEELIFLIDRAEEIIGLGDLWVQLQGIFSKRINKPFYLFPIVRKGVSDLYHWLRWRILCPPFEKVYIDTDETSQQHAMEAVLRMPVEVIGRSENKEEMVFSSDDMLPSRSRGLFILRAQPFHRGHAAIIEQMSQESEEIIVVVAMANVSHSAENIATGGERLAMILPFLYETVPHRYYLATMAYSEFSLENFYELEYLLPPFTCVYTNNPSVEALAKSCAYPTKAVIVDQYVSGTMIRERMRCCLPYEEYLPPNVFTFLSQSGIDTRLKMINAKEMRLTCVG